MCVHGRFSNIQLHNFMYVYSKFTHKFSNIIPYASYTVSDLKLIQKVFYAPVSQLAVSQSLAITINNIGT